MIVPTSETLTAHVATSVRWATISPRMTEGIVEQKLKEAGAIVFAKTSVSTSMLIGETTNKIIGSTLNPYNRSLQAGGASGGHGALLAL